MKRSVVVLLAAIVLTCVSTAVNAAIISNQIQESNPDGGQATFDTIALQVITGGPLSIPGFVNVEADWTQTYGNSNAAVIQGTPTGGELFQFSFVTAPVNAYFEAYSGTQIADYGIMSFDGSGQFNNAGYTDLFFTEAAPSLATVIADARSPSAVPEPSTFIIWSLLGSVALGFGWWRKRKAA